MIEKKYWVKILGDYATKNNSANKYIILLNNTIFLLINFFGSFKFCVGKLYNIIKKADETKQKEFI